jgi:hypothetical protein
MKTRLECLEKKKLTISCMILDILLESRRNPVQGGREVKRLDIVTDKCVNKGALDKIPCRVD